MTRCKTRALLRCSGWGDDCLDCPQALAVPESCNWDCPTCMWIRQCPCVDPAQVRRYWIERGERHIDDHLLVDVRNVLPDPALPLTNHLQPLVEAIRSVGIALPLLVRVAPHGKGWERYQVLDAVSQRGLLAAREAGVKMVPVVVKENLYPEDLDILRAAVTALVREGV